MHYLTSKGLGRFPLTQGNLDFAVKSLCGRNTTVSSTALQGHTAHPSPLACVSPDAEARTWRVMVLRGCAGIGLAPSAAGTRLQWGTVPVTSARQRSSAGSTRELHRDPLRQPSGEQRREGRWGRERSAPSGDSLSSSVLLRISPPGWEHWYRRIPKPFIWHVSWVIWTATSPVIGTVPSAAVPAHVHVQPTWDLAPFSCSSEKHEGHPSHKWLHTQNTLWMLVFNLGY